MTRPATLFETAERIAAGSEPGAALAEFLDTFYAAPSGEARAEEPGRPRGKRIALSLSELKGWWQPTAKVDPAAEHHRVIARYVACLTHR